MAQAQKPLRRQAEDGRLMPQPQVAGKGRRAGCPQGAIGRPRVALAGGAKALGKVHLITVAGEDISLDALDGLLVLRDIDVGSESAVQHKGSIGAWRRLTEQLLQAQSFRTSQRGVKD